MTSAQPITRNARAFTTDAFIARALSALGPDGVLCGAACGPFETDFYGRAGRARAVLSPANTQEVSAALQVCREFGATVVPQSGNTGLVGASTPDESGNQVVLSLRRLDEIEAVDDVNRSIVVGSGVRMSQLRKRLNAAGFWFPFDIAADPCVGGMIASNTGGSHLMRYGDVRRSVLGLEAVLADGTVFDSMKALRKDNTGIDFKQLFVGSGGVCGIITRAVLEVQRRPLARASALLVPHCHSDLPELLRWFELQYGELLTSFEGLSGNAIRYAYQTFPGLHRLFTDDDIPDYAVLVELTSSCRFQAQALVRDVYRQLEQLAERSVVRSVFTREEENYWELRDAVPRALMRQPRVLTFDVSFARSGLTAFRAALRNSLDRDHPGVVLADFGHFADGGDHVTVVIPDEVRGSYRAVGLMKLRSELYDLVAQHGGSFSAEHGIGPLNESAYRRYTRPATRRLGSSIKLLLDPEHRLGRLRRP